MSLKVLVLFVMIHCTGGGVVNGGGGSGCNGYHFLTKQIFKNLKNISEVTLKASPFYVVEGRPSLQLDVSDMVGQRRPAFLLLCLHLICQVEAESTVFVVKAEGYRDGLYAEDGERADHRFKKLGEPDMKGRYCYIYRGTERADTWAVGRGRSFEERVAVFKAPAGGGGLPPEEGWQWVDDGSRDGKESGKEQPDMRVTGFNLKETTVDEFYKKGGEKRDDGIVCKIRDMKAEYKSEEWTHMRPTDEKFCDKTRNCENGLDEPEEVCQQQVVVVVLMAGTASIIIETVVTSRRMHITSSSRRAAYG